MSTQTVPEATATPVEYAVSCLPVDHPAARYLTIKVAYRGLGLWAVTRDHECLNSAGEWDYEPSASGREDDWLAGHRFALDEALRLAREAAPHLSVNGRGIADVLARDTTTAKETGK